MTAENLIGFIAVRIIQPTPIFAIDSIKHDGIDDNRDDGKQSTEPSHKQHRSDRQIIYPYNHYQHQDKNREHRSYGYIFQAQVCGSMV